MQVHPIGSDGSARRTGRWLGGIVAAVVLAAAAIAGYLTLEAIDQRRGVASAAELRIAAMTVASAGAMTELGATTPPDQIADAVAALRGNHRLALQALPAATAEHAEQLLAELAGLGGMLMTPEGARRELHDDEELLTLLDTASQRAAAAAARSERRAALGILGALVAAALGAATLIGTGRRRRTASAQAAARDRARRRMEELLSDASEIVMVIDGDDRITYRSPSATGLLPLNARNAESLVILAPRESRDDLRRHLRTDIRGESQTFQLDGVGGLTGWFEVRVSDRGGDEMVAGRVVTIRDITAEVRLRDELEHRARTDFLTGLPNGRALDAILARIGTDIERRDVPMALVLLDIDGFTSINDRLGHLSGDHALQLIGERLRQAIAPSETLLRLNGDEFAVVLPRIVNAHAARMRGEQLLTALDEAIDVGDRSERVRASMGVALARRADDFAGLLGRADLAVRTAKHRGGHGVVVHEPSLDEQAFRVTRVAAALRAADPDREFALVYQPIVAADRDRIAGVEALLRWNSPELGTVYPDEFIPIAEESGTICGIGHWVVEQVCEQLAQWTAAGIDPSITVSFNVSPRQLAEEGFVRSLLATAERWDVAPSRLAVEATESIALARDDTVRRLEQMRAAGIHVSIDDFGTGYSNMGQLLRIPFDAIKVDRSLLLTLSAMREQAGGDPTAACNIMASIVGIARTMRAPVVCEGVETETQRMSVRASGVDYVQGYLTGCPLPAAEITERLCAAGAFDAPVGA